MNVLILADLVVFSGVGKYIVELSETLSNQGRVVVAAPVIERHDLSDSILTKLLPAPQRLLHYLLELHNVINNYDIDVVHCNHRKQMFMMRLYQSVYGKIPVVWTCHTVPYPNNMLKRILGYYGHKVIAISSEAYNWMHNELHIQEDKIDLILNGVNDSPLIPSIGNKDKKKTDFLKKYSIEVNNGILPKIIVLHGRIDYVKGLDVFVEAFSKIEASIRQNVLVLFSGDTNVPYYSELLRLIRENGIADYCKFVGWVETNEILSVADLMVAPSRREGFPLSAIEAFLMKVPLIRTKTGGYSDMANCCVGLNVGDTDSFKKEIEKWLISPEVYAEMVDEAYSFVKENCTIEKMANKTIETYKKAINICQAS